MAKVFISYSSSDADTARNIAEELVRFRHKIWLDECEIEVGDSIVQRISEGLEDCTHIILLLSENSVSSKWVEREWSSAYMDEIESGKVKILPARLDDCVIPAIIRDRKYADFRSSFTHGMICLIAVLSPTIDTNTEIDKEQIRITRDKDLQELISESQTGKLSECLAHAIPIAHRYNDTELLDFCQGELTGWKLTNQEEVREKEIGYRVAELFFSPFKRVNLSSPIWGENPNTVLDFLRNEEDVYAMSYFIPNQISDLENQLTTGVTASGVLTLEIPLGHLIPDIKDQDASHKVSVYGHPRAIPQIINGTRSKLLSQLIYLLPSISIE